VSLKLFSAGIALDERDRVPGQIIKAVKRLAHETVLQSTPSLYEPVFTFDALVSESRAINLVRNALAQRRGDVREVSSVPGTPLHRVRGFVPVLDSYGLETEIRFRSRGSVFPQMFFEGWSLVPGNPLDDSVALKPLEPSPPELLARDLVVKTRRRKGLPELIEQPRVLDQQVLLRELERAKQQGE
jgi:U5 small nuclear ribonucleoprotein component